MLVGAGEVSGGVREMLSAGASFDNELLAADKTGTCSDVEETDVTVSVFLIAVSVFGPLTPKVLGFWDA